MTHRLRFAARTDRGLLRSTNQDSVYAGNRLLVVADGMGGHAAGDVASRLVVAAFVPLDETPSGDDVLGALRRAVGDGNRAIAQVVRENPDLAGMGTTLDALLFDGPRIGLVHVGDSRGYLYRAGVLHQITHDDTFVQSLIDEGRITEEEAHHHPQRSLILKALNGTPVDPVLTLREAKVGDRYLLCSDGLSSVVSAEAIADALAGQNPDDVADRLIELALVGGGPDNVTVIVADVLDVGAPPAPAELPDDNADPEATGPILPIHMTQKMPRIALPPHDAPTAIIRPAGGPHWGKTAASGGDVSGDLVDELADDQSADADEESADDGTDTGLDDGDLDDTDLGDTDAHDNNTANGATAGPADGADGPRGNDAARGTGGPESPGVRSPNATARSRVTRRLAFGLAVVVLLGLALGGTTLWTRSQYFVGQSAGEVVIFRGVNGSILGLQLASVAENSCPAGAAACVPLRITDLVPAARDQVAAGIPADSLAAARTVISRLSGELLPLCPLPDPDPLTPAPTPTTASTRAVEPTTPAPDGRPTVLVTVRTTVTAPVTAHGAGPGTVPPTTATRPEPPAKGTVTHRSTAPVTRTVTETVTVTPAGTPLPTVTPVPGVTCREVG